MLDFGVCGVNTSASSKQSRFQHRRGLDKQYTWVGKTQLLLALLLTSCVFLGMLLCLPGHSSILRRGQDGPWLVLPPGSY